MEMIICALTLANGINSGQLLQTHQNDFTGDWIDGPLQGVWCYWCTPANKVACSVKLTLA